MVEPSKWVERFRAAHVALEQWRSLPKGQHRRRPLEELAAAYPDVITVEWLPDNRVKIRATEYIG